MINKLQKINNKKFKNKFWKIPFKYYKTLIFRIYQIFNFKFQIIYLQKKKIWIRMIKYYKLYKISNKQKLNIKNSLNNQQHKIKLILINNHNKIF